MTIEKERFTVCFRMKTSEARYLSGGSEGVSADTQHCYIGAGFLQLCPQFVMGFKTYEVALVYQDKELFSFIPG